MRKLKTNTNFTNTKLYLEHKCHKKLEYKENPGLKQ